MAARFSLAILTISLAVAFSPQQAWTQSLESLELATNLGSVIAAEEYCGLNYDQAAVAVYIERKVKSGDMSFPSSLQMMIEGSKFQQQSMSASAKTAHCTQIKRIAQTYGFIK